MTQAPDRQRTELAMGLCIALGLLWALAWAWVLGHGFVGPPNGWGNKWLFMQCVALPKLVAAVGMGLTWRVQSPTCRTPLRLSLGLSLLGPLAAMLPFLLVGFGLPVAVALASLLLCWAVPAWLAAVDAGHKLRVAEEPRHLAWLCIAALVAEAMSVFWVVLEAAAGFVPDGLVGEW